MKNEFFWVVLVKYNNLMEIKKNEHNAPLLGLLMPREISLYQNLWNLVHWKKLHND